MPESIPSGAFFKIENTSNSDQILLAAQSETIGPIILHGTGKKNGAHSINTLDKVSIKRRCSL